MNYALRVLMLENTGDDANLLLRALRRGGYEVTCDVVETPAALPLVKTLRPDVPFIIVSDDLALHLAAPLMKGDAQD